jgi:hypothetical protein
MGGGLQIGPSIVEVTKTFPRVTRDKNILQIPSLSGLQYSSLLLEFSAK